MKAQCGVTDSPLKLEWGGDHCCIYKYLSESQQLYPIRSLSPQGVGILYLWLTVFTTSMYIFDSVAITLFRIHIGVSLILLTVLYIASTLELNGWYLLIRRIRNHRNRAAVSSFS